MICCYLIPIFIIWYNYSNNTNSISCIICDDKCKYIVFLAFLTMGIFTAIYEYQRKDPVSLIIILVLLANIYCLIFVNETVQTHYLFAAFAFIFILFFCFWHCLRLFTLNIQNNILFLLAILQLFFFIFTCINVNNENIFIYEVFFLLNFAVFYLYLHTIESIDTNDYTIGTIGTIGPASCAVSFA
jgi:hypothetical protein